MIRTLSIMKINTCLNHATHLDGNLNKANANVEKQKDPILERRCQLDALHAITVPIRLPFRVAVTAAKCLFVAHCIILSKCLLRSRRDNQALR